jgi:Spy/CpxP family protein refolding chaperone
MNAETRLRSSRIGLPIVLPVVLLLAGICVKVRSQTPTSQNPAEPATTQNQPQIQINQLPDLAPLNLSPDQIQKIRAINAELKEQRQAANQRQRLAQRALAEAIESPTPNEALIEQRSREVAEAQATTIRLRSLTEARILQVMTPEQRIRLREMRQRNQEIRRQQNQQLPDYGLRPRQQGLKRNVNAQQGLTPKERKLMRRQQRP